MLSKTERKHMSDTATADHPESLAMEKVHRELQVLRNRVEDLEDLRDLGEAIAENADKSLIPWVYAKKDLDLIDPFESTTRPKGCRFRASVPEIEYLRWTRRMTSALILLMRHAEKPLDPRDPDLSDAGKARADALARYIPQDVAKPDFLFAPAASKVQRSSDPDADTAFGKIFASNQHRNCRSRLPSPLRKSWRGVSLCMMPTRR